MKKLILLSIILCFCKVVEAQCTFDPTINGEFILCPNSTTILSTQIYDSYQWHRRLFTEPNSSPIPGDTLQTIEVSSDSDTPYFFSVETTLDGCTEFSPEELVDGLTFLPVAVISTGDFETGNNGESIVCMGDTINYTLNLPYDTNITWFKDGVSISGETSISLSVSTPGQYGVTLEVLFINCMTSTNEELLEEEIVLIFPNPATDQFLIKSEGEEITDLSIFNYLGQQVQREIILDHEKVINISGLDKGIYLIEINKKRRKGFRKLIVL